MASPAPSLALDRLGQVAVPVRDIERATAFYRDTLGMTHLFSAGNLAFFDCGGVRLMLDVPEDDRFRHPASILYYPVEDLDAAFGTLKQTGATVVQEPHMVAKMPDHELWMAFFEDSEANVFALMAERR